MPWLAAATIASSLIGVGSSLYGGSQQAGAAQDAAQAQVQAAGQTNALNKYIYDTTRSDYQPYRDVGGNALYQISDLLGLPRSSGPGGVAGAAPNSAGPSPPQSQDAATLAQIRQGLQTWNATYPGADSGLIKLIDSGAPLSQVAQALQGLRGSTTNPKNTAFLDPIIQTASNAVNYPTPQNAFTAQPGQTYDNSQAGITGRQTNAFNSFRTDPGYQFAFGQGQKAVQNSAAARGVLNSGQTVKALDQFGQGIADQQYGNWFNRLQSAAGIGQNATGSTAQAGQNFATGSGNALMAAGNARASGYQGVGNAYAGAAGGVAQSANQGIQNYLLMNAFNGGGGSGSPGSWSPYGYAY